MRERDELLAAMKKKGVTIHLARVHALCYEKGSELPMGDPERKMRARSVLLGDNVVDTWFQEAEMEALAVPLHPWKILACLMQRASGSTTK